MCDMQTLQREQRMLGLQSDFAMVFEDSATSKESASSSGNGPYSFWLGKVQRLIRVFGRRKVEYREPIDLDNFEGPILLVAKWY
jgi:hypothetical protein